MTENISTLVKTSYGYRKTLENIFNHFGNVTVSDEVILRMQKGLVDSSYLFNEITKGLGRPKSHCSEEILGQARHEGEFKSGGKYKTRNDSMRRSH